MIKMGFDMNSGVFVNTDKGYTAFKPSKLVDVEKELDISEIQFLIERANLAVGELRAMEKMLPNPALLMERYALKESVLSSQIEGTQSTLVDVLEKENDTSYNTDIREVKNYFNALNFGVNNLRRDDGLPLSGRLLRECHRILMSDVRGGDRLKTPGEFRTSQNWIGGSCPANATYVPPVASDIDEYMSDIENYIHHGMHPNMVKAALVHYQFETLHPFQDGNGRIGRLLILLFMIDKKILNSPTLYISLYLKKMQNEYYASLTKVRHSADFIQWIKFFLAGVIAVSEQTMTTTKKIIELENKDRARLKTGSLIRAFDVLMKKPVVSIKEMQEELGVTNATANLLIKKLEAEQILVQKNNKQRYRIYAYKDYLDIIESGL